MPNIPSVDLNNFLSDDQSLKQEFVNKLGKAYQDIGFVALKGHFLKDSDIENIYKYIKVFFDLPEEIKSKYELCLLYTSPSPRDDELSRMPSSA